MSPTIRATIAQFNAVTNQVIMSLLCQPADPTSSPTSSCRPPTTPAQRARIIEKWIRVAQVSQRAGVTKHYAAFRICLPVPNFRRTPLTQRLFKENNHRHKSITGIFDLTLSESS